MTEAEGLPTGLRVPRHVAIIMDGNGRWAKERGLPRTDGHIQGQEALRATLKAATKLGIEALTVYAFSTENWNRPQEEVDALMELLVRALHSETPELIARGVRLKAIGDISRLSPDVLVALDEAIERTAHCERITLAVALSYSSRDELTRVATELVRRAERDELASAEVSEELIDGLLDTADLPPLDLLIRTGREWRISNFLLWQAAYAELYFSEYYWPDFGYDALREAVLAYGTRERRFGLTSEQLDEQDDSSEIDL